MWSRVDLKYKLAFCADACELWIDMRKLQADIHELLVDMHQLWADMCELGPIHIQNTNQNKFRSDQSYKQHNNKTIESAQDWQSRAF